MSDGQLDPHKPTQIFVTGKKGEGKTELAWMLFESYPYDRLVIDPNGDLKVPENTIELDSADLPDRWPSSLLEKKESRTLRLVPDAGSPTYLEDMDHCVGLAYNHQRTCVFVDECHELLPANRTPPHSRRMLRQGRHRGLTSILATPRPKTIDPLAISNADWVYSFKLKNPEDRKRVAENIGWAPKEIDDAIAALGQFEYLRYDDARDDLAHFPALPADVIKHHKR
jgi:Zonular occludens toxin (Zot)